MKFACQVFKMNERERHHVDMLHDLTNTSVGGSGKAAAFCPDY
jgi:hypothetical protein